MRVPRSTNFLLLSCMFTILLPFTRPNCIMTEVVIMFRIIFCPVPDFMRELPVTYSGPTIISMATSASAAMGESGLLVMQPVRMPCSRASCMAPITYGVVPDAAMPMTVSLSVMLRSVSSSHPRCVSSSAFSTGLRNAVSPPAISPMTNVGGMPKVGGISEASSTPRRPLVPAPM